MNSTETELQTELGPLVRDHKITPKRLISYLFSDKARYGYSGPLHQQAVEMAEDRLLADKAQQEGNHAAYGYYNSRAIDEAVGIFMQLTDAGVLDGRTTAHDLSEWHQEAARQRPMGRVVEHFRGKLGL